MNLSIFKVLETGGPTMWFIAALSILAVTVAVERASALWAFTSRAKTLADTVNRCLSRGAMAEGRTACERSKSPLADVFLVGFERLGRPGHAHLETAVDRARQRVTMDLKVRLWILGTIGALAPFIGLWGTVIGIMNAFKSIAEHGGGGFNHVSAGIS